MVRSVISVLTGIATLTFTSFTMEAALKPLTQSAVVLFLYSTFCVVLGGYVTAWIAVRARVRHAVIMGIIQALLVIPAMIAFPQEAPLWRWLFGMALIVPAAWCGGVVYERRAAHV
jgi:hypothetical protein